MTYTAEIHSDDFTGTGHDCLRESGYHGVQDCPSDWEIGSNEAGERIYCEAAISGFLHCDVV
jgi:hypothetical protein